MLKRMFGGKKGSKASAVTSSSGPGAPTTPTQPQAHVGVPSGTALTLSALERMGEAEELLAKRRDLLEKKIAHELARAREFTQQNNKRAALMALKKKKLYEQQLEQVENNMLRLGEQQAGLEGLSSTALVVGAIQTGAQAGKAAMQEIGVERVDALLDDISDQAEQMRQIQDVLGQPVGAAADIDEDELAAEMEALEAEQVDETALQAAAAPAHKVPAPLPSTPAAAAPARVAPRPQPQKTPEEEELEALQAEMAA